jgi:hypothetical protein
MKLNLHGLARAKYVLSKNRLEVALLVGNGINRAARDSEGISWKELLQTLIKEASRFAEKPKQAEGRLLRLLEEDKLKRTPASNPEVFDLIEATCNLDPGATQGRIEKIKLQSRISELLRMMRPGKPHRLVVSWAETHSVPVLTTNYDHCLQDALGNLSCTQRRLKPVRRVSDYYPWDRYYAPQSLSDPLDSFAIWHIHGDRVMRQSIRAGLDQYMGMVERLRSLKHKVAREILSAPNEDHTKDPAYLEAPWLRVFMGRKLWIQGLALHADEVSLRWLLIQRFRYWKRYKPEHRHCSGWYVHGPTNVCGSLDDDRRAFFESVGLEIIEIKRPENIYEALFNRAS